MAKAPNNRGASKATAQQRQIPGWVWLFTGIVTGLFIAFLFHLAKVQMHTPQKNDLAANESTETGSEEDESDNKPRFDFYAVLPQMEVIVPQGQQSDEQPDSEKLSHRHNENYLLQAGSFRNSQDADSRRAELLLQGFDVHIQKARINNGDIWHRVMIGPFDNANTMHRSQDKLSNLGIKTLPIRVAQPETEN